MGPTKLNEKWKGEVLCGARKLSSIVDVDADYERKELRVVGTIACPSYDVSDCEVVGDHFAPKKGAVPCEWNNQEVYVVFGENEEVEYMRLEKMYGEELSRFEITCWFWMDIKEEVAAGD